MNTFIGIRIALFACPSSNPEAMEVKEDSAATAPAEKETTTKGPAESRSVLLLLQLKKGLLLQFQLRRRSLPLLLKLWNLKLMP